MSTKAMIITAATAVSCLLIAVLVVGIMLLNTMNAQAANEKYQECMARHGHAVDQPPPSVSTDAEVNAYIEQLAAAAEECSR